ncbi:MAG: DEAD/DEAH box helicase, partial [Firmicutes bacterium]|nr:DEAD/DEAH box helicase [Bacillota bacterium]
LIADYLIDRAILRRERIIYTAPIKALSNQKFKEFKALYGEERVGIITGDVVINASADVAIMTTEIFRNILHQDPGRLEGITHVVFDEIHYLSDEDRGTVWEESIIFMPKEMRLLGLSATIPNAEELAAWIAEIKGHEVAVVHKTDRSVPLHHHFYERHLGTTTLPEIKKYLARMTEDPAVAAAARRATRHLDLVKHVAKTGGLPCLYFVFSRRLCEEMAQELAGMRTFLNPAETARVERLVEELYAEYGLDELKHLARVKDVLARGVAFHHAGLLPALKEIVETLFGLGLVKVMYATETFAVGINYPVKTVCFDSPTKFDGFTFRPMTTLEYFQMAGRAGRRGIDTRGTVYLLADLTRFRAADYPSTREEDILPLESRFELSFNTVLNLKRNYSSAEIQVILDRNFATFQARNERARLEEELRAARAKAAEIREGLCPHREAIDCPNNYRRLKNRLKKRQYRLAHGRTDSPEAILAEIEAIRGELAGVRPRSCQKSQQRRCRVLNRRYEEATELVGSLYRRVSEIKVAGRFAEALAEKERILTAMGYLHGETLLPRGLMAAEIYAQELLLTEIYYAGLLHELDVDQINALLVGVDYEPRKGEGWPRELPFDPKPIRKILRDLIYRYGVEEKDARFHPALANLAYRWSRGCTFAELLKGRHENLQEGDIVIAFRREIDLLRQLRVACRNDEAIAEKLRECMHRMDRDLIQVRL